MGSVRVLMIGDRSDAVTAHRANPEALRSAGAAAGCHVESEWPGTVTLEKRPDLLERFDAFWCVPASPYASTEGALRSIRYARENGVPFLGTCGGFQHAVLEYARTVLGLPDADHEELNPGTRVPLISRLSCSLVEERGEIVVDPASMAGGLLEEHRLVEEYHCNYGLNPRLETLFDRHDLRVVGRDLAGEPRVVELRSHPFFLCTLFQPERTALRGSAHPFIVGWLRAALQRRARVGAATANGQQPTDQQPTDQQR